MTRLWEIQGPSQPLGDVPSAAAMTGVVSAMRARSSASGRMPWRSELVRPCPTTSSPRARTAAITSGQ